MNDLTSAGIIAFSKMCHWFKVTYISLFLLPTAAATHTTITSVISESSNLKKLHKNDCAYPALLCSISHFCNNVTSMISTNSRNNNGQITQLHFSKWKAKRKMINYYINSYYKIQFTGLIFHGTFKFMY